MDFMHSRSLSGPFGSVHAKMRRGQVLPVKLVALQLFRDTFENIDVEVSAYEAKQKRIKNM